MFFLLMFLFNISQVEASDKYKEAIKVTSEAILKKTGLESDFLKVKKVSEQKARLWVKQQGLERVVTVGSLAYPIFIKKRIRFKVKDVIFTGSKNRIEASFSLQF